MCRQQQTKRGLKLASRKQGNKCSIRSYMQRHLQMCLETVCCHSSVRTFICLHFGSMPFFLQEILTYIFQQNVRPPSCHNWFPSSCPPPKHIKSYFLPFKIYILISRYLSVSAYSNFALLFCVKCPKTRLLEIIFVLVL